MLSTNTGNKRKASKFDKYTAHASRYSKRLRYMGLRVKRNGPVVTRDDVAAGLVGFIVVFARQTEAMPEMPKTRPREARTSATATRAPNGTSTGAASEDANHMRKPKNSATAGGGTFSSSELMATKVRHNVRVERRAATDTNPTCAADRRVRS